MKLLFVKLLFDQNLSRKLVTRLADIFPESSSVEVIFRSGFETIQEFMDNTALDCLELY